MTRSTISILGLYSYRPDIFNGLETPIGADKQTIIDTICLDCAELELLLPNPDTLASAIALWSKARSGAWERIWNVLKAEYNPIHNFDRNEEYTDTDSNQSQTVGGTTSNSTDSQTVDRESNLSADRSTTTANPAYNTTGTTDREVVTELTETGGTENVAQTVTASGEVNTTNNSTSSGNRTHTGHLFGNIGVTRTQEMILDELALRNRDFTSIIVEEFRFRFCLGNY